MEIKLKGKLIKGVGGLYAIRIGKDDSKLLKESGIELSDDTVFCKARGVFRHDKLTLLAGDEVLLRIDTELATADSGENDLTNGANNALAGVMIDEVLPRKNELIRPPMSNLDILFVVFAAEKPTPDLLTIDKLMTIAEYKSIEPVIIITKADIAPELAEKYADIYIRCGFSVFVQGISIDSGELEAFIFKNADKQSAFAGASGVGKSTLLNRLFPSLNLEVGEISHKTARGRHTTRHIELYPLSKQFGESATGYLADTPGFGMLDFLQFDFYKKQDLPYVFREFEPYISECRYTKCTHTKEEGCALLEAVKRGEVPSERHKSYLEFYEVLKNKHDWNKK